VQRPTKIWLDRARAAGYRAPTLDRSYAEYWALAGDVEKSIEALGRVLAVRPIYVVSLRHSVLDVLRENEEFIDIVERNRTLINQTRIDLGWEQLPENYADPTMDTW